MEKFAFIDILLCILNSLINFNRIVK